MTETTPLSAQDLQFRRERMLNAGSAILYEKVAEAFVAKAKAALEAFYANN